MEKKVSEGKKGRALKIRKLSVDGNQSRYPDPRRVNMRCERGPHTSIGVSKS